jgi:hypothetical protein
VRTAFCLDVVCARAETPLSSSFTSPARERSLCRRAMSLYMVERRGAGRRYRAVSVEFLKNKRADEALGGVLENAVQLVAYEFPESR